MNAGYIFKLEFSLNICPRVGLHSHKATLFLFFKILKMYIVRNKFTQHKQGSSLSFSNFLSSSQEVITIT